MPRNSRAASSAFAPSVAFIDVFAMLALALASLEPTSIKDLPIFTAVDPASPSEIMASLSIRLHANGTLSIDSEPIEWEDIPSRISNLSHDANLQVAVETGADGNGPVQSVLRLADIAEQSQRGEKIRFLVAQKSQQP
jgi:biopolymer transport protein ExbD